MSTRNTEYDFKWCPGCGDFGVRRALEGAMAQHMSDNELPVEQNVVVAGIGCSGNLVHLLEGPQPYGFHGIHGRTLPVSMGIKSARPDLNVIVVAGDGDFLGIGLEHIAPQATRNLDVACIIMDNGTYGLTKGQASPTTKLGDITSSTPYGKIEKPLNPLSIYLTMGVSFVASAFSSKVKELTSMIVEAMAHPGFAIINVQSPCTTYNNTFEQLKGNKSKNIQPVLWEIPSSHDITDKDAAFTIAQSPGIPMGIIHKSTEQPPFHQGVKDLHSNSKRKSAEQLISTYKL